MTAIMVTGGAGYIGSHVCKALAAAGYIPVTVDNLSRGHAETVRWGPLVVGDISDGKALDEAFRRHQVAGIIHLAAFAYVGESVTDPGLYYRNNVCGTLNLMDAAHRAGGLPMVFSSTCATYGIPHRVPIDESMPQNPINPYGRTKLHIEQMLADFEAAHQQRWTALRYFNAAGADPDGETGELHDPEPHLIPLAIAAAVSGGSMGVFGTDYPTPDGTAERDYIHVSDLATAHVLALKRLLDGGASLAVNLGTGRGWSVRQVLDTVGKVVGRPIKVIEQPRRVGDPPVLIADNRLAMETLGWRPELVELEDIVATAVRWYVARHDRPHPVDGPEYPAGTFEALREQPGRA